MINNLIQAIIKEISIVFLFNKIIKNMDVLYFNLLDSKNIENLILSIESLDLSILKFQEKNDSNVKRKEYVSHFKSWSNIGKSICLIIDSQEEKSLLFLNENLKKYENNDQNIFPHVISDFMVNFINYRLKNFTGIVYENYLKELTKKINKSEFNDKIKLFFNDLIKFEIAYIYFLNNTVNYSEILLQELKKQELGTLINQVYLNKRKILLNKLYKEDFLEMSQGILPLDFKISV